MARRAQPPKEQQRITLGTATALIGVIGAMCVLWEATEQRELFIATAIVLIVVTLATSGATIRVERQRRRGGREDALKRIVLSRKAPDRAPTVEELTPYQLGADKEADQDAPAAYVPRDRDADLRTALADARTAAEPRMVVLRGPSKSGKSRTLYEAVAADPDLRKATVLAPRSLDDLAAILDDRRPAPACGTVILWLDGLEQFVSPGHVGMDRDALDELARWRPSVVVVATAGGTSADLTACDGLTVPIDRLYNHRSVVEVALDNRFSARERAEVTRRFEPEIAAAINECGIGEYFVAAPALVRKLESERHTANEPACREGAAVAWAAIDCARSGITRPIDRELLRAVWPCYLHGLPATDKHFEDGLEWALRPVYRSVALLREESGFQPYGWVVDYAERKLGREPNQQALTMMLERLAPEDAFDIGLAAPGTEAGRRAFELAAAADDSSIAAASELNLGLLQSREGALVDAARAYRRAVALDAGHDSAQAALHLGALEAQRGDLDAARAAFRLAQASADAALACQASLQLGEALLEHGADGAEHELQRAVGSPDPEVAASSRALLEKLNKTSLLKPLGEDEARAELQRAYALECDGELEQAESRYRAVVEHGPYDVAALAAFGLGELLDSRADYEGAQDAYAWAIETEDPEVAPAARLALGQLFARGGDPRARATLEQAAQAADPTIAEAARTKLEELT
jgi:Tfp pilus assembly protein PilF